MYWQMQENTFHICLTFKFRMNAQHDLLPAINEQEIIICPYTLLLLHLHQDGEGQLVTSQPDASLCSA